MVIFQETNHTLFSQHQPGETAAAVVDQVMSADIIQGSCTRLTISIPKLGLTFCFEAVSKVTPSRMGAFGSRPKPFVTHPHVRTVCLISNPADLNLEWLAVFVSYLVQAVGMGR